MNPLLLLLMFAPPGSIRRVLLGFAGALMSVYVFGLVWGLSNSLLSW